MARAEQSLDRRARGDAVETAALGFLQRHGLRLLARNAQARGGELDLVMLDGDSLVFVEVRYRAGTGFGGGAASVDAGKRRKLVRAAQTFLLRHPQHAESPCRFDVIDARGDPAKPRIEWLKDAFRADD
ncbi:YraN family protein [Thermomonas sp. HDW16]|uniref:YraN family protein n=1 Tax=Thermomonas sp. HDW16 TaxID=2714945 RepID=UPI00140B3A06|nr:YraN family protein [Thermomonas sp. HDW16]QIL21459.1 YraN family protein [Thermomonas sp. HDW16]